MAQQKISDLTQEEQDKIITQMKELNIQGGALCKTWTVENVQKKIAKALEAKGETPATLIIKAAQASETPAAPPAETPETPTETPAEKQQPAAKKVKETKEEKQETPLKCHICRSDVIDGKCTGCGFSLGV